MKLLYWAVLAIMAGLYAVLLLSTEPTLSAYTGGLPLFDLRPFGYSLADAREYLSALSRAGQSYYLTRWFALDMTFLMFLTVSFMSTLWQLYRRPALAWRVAIIVLPLLYGGFDAAENFRVAILVSGGVDGLTQANVAAASLMTQGKFVVFFILVAMVVAGLLRRFRAKAAR